MKSAEEAAQAKPQPNEEAPPANIGGLAGRILARRAAKKDPEPAPAAAAASDTRATFMTMQHEVLKVSPSVTEADLQIPAGFKLKN